MPSAESLKIDRDRVAVLLLINSLLVKKAHEVYVTTLSNRITIQQMPPQSRQIVVEQYNNINRRLQCNLSVLSHLDNLYNNKLSAQQPNRIEFPVILSPPAEMPELRPLYKRLQDLYPEAIEFLKMKMHQMKQQQEGQAPQMLPNGQGPQMPQLSRQQLGHAPQKTHSKPTSSSQKEPLMAHQRQHYQHQAVPPFNSIQDNEQPQFRPVQANIQREQSTMGATSKIPVQHHLPQHHSKHLDTSYSGGISPQMMSKEADTNRDPVNSLVNRNIMNKKAHNMSSISPQQILQQQAPASDLSMDFL